MLEENFRRAMLLSRGDFSIFVSRPISGTLLAFIACIILFQFRGFFRKRKQAAALQSQAD